MKNTIASKNIFRAIGEVVAILLAVSPCWVLASTDLDAYSKTYQDCLSKAENLDNMVVHACAGDILGKVNAEMVQKLKSLRKAYLEEAPQDVEKLDDSQKFWESYKDMQCELSGIHIGSPMYSVCPMEKAIQRLKEINDLLQQ